MVVVRDKSGLCSWKWREVPQVILESTGGVEGLDVHYENETFSSRKLANVEEAIGSDGLRG